MQYRVFLSHAQADAAGTARVVHDLLAKRGVHCWLDMLQQNITLEGMKLGVKHSDVFLLILTESVLTRDFCRKELLEAIRLNKRIVALVELDPRFKPFPIQAWKAGASNIMVDKGTINEREVLVRGFKVDSLAIEDFEKVCEVVDDCLDMAVPYRRRDFEADAMVLALCARMGLRFPDKISAVDTTNEPTWRGGGGSAGVEAGATAEISGAKLRVAVIGTRSFSEFEGIFDGPLMESPFLKELKKLPGLCFEEATEATVSADDIKVLVLLSKGVLTGTTLALLEAALAQGDANRLVFVCRAGPPSCLPSEGWSFNPALNPELNGAPLGVKASLDDNEAVTFRAPSSGGASHEFSALIAHLGERLGRSLTSTAPSAASRAVAAEDMAPLIGPGTTQLAAATAADKRAREAAEATERETVAVEQERATTKAASERERELKAEIAALQEALLAAQRIPCD